jgi:hypothetical protein
VLQMLVCPWGILRFTHQAEWLILLVKRDLLDYFFDMLFEEP